MSTDDPIRQMFDAGTNPSHRVRDSALHEARLLQEASESVKAIRAHKPDWQTGELTAASAAAEAMRSLDFSRETTALGLSDSVRDALSSAGMGSAAASMRSALGSHHAQLTASMRDIAGLANFRSVAPPALEAMTAINAPRETLAALAGTHITDAMSLAGLGSALAESMKYIGSASHSLASDLRSMASFTNLASVGSAAAEAMRSLDFSRETTALGLSDSVRDALSSAGMGSAAASMRSALGSHHAQLTASMRDIAGLAKLGSVSANALRLSANSSTASFANFPESVRQSIEAATFASQLSLGLGELTSVLPAGLKLSLAGLGLDGSGLSESVSAVSKAINALTSQLISDSSAATDSIALDPAPLDVIFDHIGPDADFGRADKTAKLLEELVLSVARLEKQQRPGHAATVIAWLVAIILGLITNALDRRYFSPDSSPQGLPAASSPERHLTVTKPTSSGPRPHSKRRFQLQHARSRADIVDLKAGRRSRSHVVGRLQLDAEVIVISKDAGWIFVIRVPTETTPSMVGWAKSKYFAR